MTKNEHQSAGEQQPLDGDEQWKILFEQAPTGILLAETESRRFTRANPAICRMLGYTEPELLLKGIADIHPAAALPQVMAEFEAQARGEKTLAESLPVLRKDGEVIYADVNAAALVVDGREVMAGFFTDVTARRRSELEYRTVVQTSQDGFWSVDLSGRLREVNDAYCRMSGHSRSELLRMNIADLEAVMPPELIKRNIEEFRRAGHVRFETRHRGKDGRVYDVEVSATYLPESGGFFSFLRDITERKRAEAALKTANQQLRASEQQLQAANQQLIAEEEELRAANETLRREMAARERAENDLRALHQRLEFILGATKTGLDIIDADFNVRYVDPEWARVYGGYAGRKCHEYFMGMKAPCPTCGIPEALRERKITVTEELLVKEGSRPIQVTTIPFQDQASGEWLVAEVNVDITERKRMEEMLVRAERLAAASQLAAGVAHEFNNILAIIRTQAQIMKLDEKHAADSPVREQAGIIEEQTRRGAEIASSMIALARPPSPRFTSLRPADVVAEVLRVQEAKLAFDNIILKETVPEAIVIEADPGMLRQVLLNLIINARHAMQPKRGGTLTITAERRGEMIALQVSDTGIGMTEEVRKQIFTPFFTTKGGHPENYTGVQGVGLGLSVSYRAIREHGGDILVESESGEGATFTVLLPLKRDARGRDEEDSGFPGR